MPDASVIDIFLQPGDFFVGDAEFRVRTLLGSCVSITLWQPDARIGAMSHFLLPGRSKGAQPDARYGNDALDLMLSGLRAQGVQASDCQAKLFGGGNMFPSRRSERPAIGMQNGAEARALLAAHAIPLLSACLYGVGHRQIIFDIASGDVWSRQFEKVEQ
ncbi:chemotaxis protein CheD [Massilia atriviolacea]|uniref:chemotaxis protein CheD n=1 Tax=Massilia atriviolacea TaxID=2495579 RepID=UPI0018E0826D|nr:chemotaxis protein CheD [Massilia atriviolacea]